VKNSKDLLKSLIFISKNIFSGFASHASAF